MRFLPWQFRSFAFLAALAAGAPAQIYSSFELDVRTYHSPSGELELRIVPSARDGTGPARYRLARGAQELWAGERELALCDAALSDEGCALGYLYGEGGPELSARFRIVVLDREGKVMRDEVHERTPSRYFHFPPDPRPAGVFAQSELDRFVLRISDEDLNRGQEQWWCYRISTGEPLERFRPDERIPGSAERGSITAVQPIRGAPLAVLQWQPFEFESGSSRIGARFAVVDAACRPLWDLDWPDDLTGGLRGEAADEHLAAARQAGSMPARREERRFALRSFREKRVREYSVEPEPSAPGGWRVRELESTPVREAAAPAPVFAELELEGLPALELQADAAPPAGSFRNVDEFGFGAEGRLRVVSAESERGAFSLLVLEESGALVSSTRIAPLADPESGKTTWTALERGRWLFNYCSYEDESKSRAWIVDETNGALEELASFEVSEVDLAAAHPSGGFVVTNGAGLWRLDESGRYVWRVSTHVYDAHGLAVTPGGEIAVLDGSSSCLQIYSADGEQRGSDDLALAWGEKPRYPAGLSADPLGGFYVLDFGDEPSYRHVDAKGTWERAIAPTDQGAPFCTYDAPRVAPNGRLWTTDRRLLVRLDAKGAVDRRLGEPILSARLAEPAAAAVDAAGCIYIQDRRSAAVHVFGRDGARKRVCMPDPADFDEGALLGALAVTAGGDLLARREMMDTEWVHFGADGKRIGVVTIGGRVWPHAAARRIWAATEHGFELRDLEKGLLHTIERFPDERWIRGNAASAPDGSLAILDKTDELEGGAATVLLVLDPEGAVTAHHRLPLLPYITGLCFRGRSILAATNAGQWLWIDTETGTIRRLRVEIEDRLHGACLAFSPDGAELWCVDARKLRVLRWRAPAR